VAYDWPGNARELRNCIERAVMLTHSDSVGVDVLPQKIRDHKSGHLLVVTDDPSEMISLEALERRYVLKVVETCKGNKSKAARVLGIGRKTLYRKLEAYGISILEA
jgi:two-component system response regulator HydG